MVAPLAVAAWVGGAALVGAVGGALASGGDTKKQARIKQQPTQTSTSYINNYNTSSFVFEPDSNNQGAISVNQRADARASLTPEQAVTSELTQEDVKKDSTLLWLAAAGVGAFIIFDRGRE